jgi:glycerol-3-phosphate dehydrogenase (NAD(P)+)
MVDPGRIPPGLDGLVVAVPAQALRRTISSELFSRKLPLLSGAKGIEHDTRLRMSQVLSELGWTTERISVVSGPNLAHEVARGLPAATVVASTSAAEAERWQRALSVGAFRAYRSDDVTGVELGGALKNIVAIAAGAAVGLGMGANAVAAIMTRGLAEMTRLGVAMGARALTFQGLAGVGDLAATCYSELSRNRRLGELLARGMAPAEAVRAIGEAVEGAATAPVALDLARSLGVEMPIAEQVAAVLAGTATVPRAMADLLRRELKPEANPGG